MPNDTTTRVVRIPVRWRDGKWVLPEGGDLPKFREEAFAELVLSPHHIVNDADRKYWSRETSYQLLNRDVSVFAAVSRKNVPDSLRERTHVLRHEGRGDRRFVEIVLKQPLKIILGAGQQGKLDACNCKIPALDESADSLNEAYSKIVTSFEPSRRSNTGSVFSKIFVEGRDQYVKLDNLRAQKINELVPSDD